MMSGENMNDSDVARQLQEQFDSELTNAAIQVLDEPWDGDCQDVNDERYNIDNIDTSKMTLVDPRWELIDPIPDIRSLFIQFNDKYFWGRLAGVEVRWSPRMTLCAGLCVYEGRAGYCSVRISEPLLKLRPRKDLIETLLHEMIHAYLFVTDNNKDHDGHGPEFHKHMYRLNNETGTAISVYHTFHDEVDNYRQHWWLCDGKCKDRPPYFGYVKRAMNRPPSPRDPWWPQHQQSCGGTYTKVKEPEGYGKKKSKKEEKKPEKPKGTVDIRNFTNGNKGSPSATTSKADVNEPAKPASVIVNGVLTTIKPPESSAVPSKPPGKSSQPTLFDKGVKKSDNDKIESLKSRENGANIHGFNKIHPGDGAVKPGKSKGKSRTGKGDKIETIKSREDGPNIHGFNSIHPGAGASGKPTGSSSSGNSSSGNSGGQATFFSSSQVLGGQTESENKLSALVRRIPGIGLITSERYGASSGASSNCDSDDAQSTSKSGRRSVIDYKSEESEFDELLDSILKPVFKKKKKKKNVDDKRIPGFTSVSNNRRHSDPLKRYKDTSESTIPKNEPILPMAERTRKSDTYLTQGTSKSEMVTSPDWKKTSRDISSVPKTKPSATITSESQANLSGPSASGSTKPKRKIIPVDHFATNRNKRALDISSSDSDSDLDEKMTLSSVMRKKLEIPAESPMKKLKLNSEPPTDVWQAHPDEWQTFPVDDPPIPAELLSEAAATEVVKMINCPVCRTPVKEIYINDHLDSCLMPTDF